MKKIPLSDGEHWVIVDDEDYESLSGHSWRLHTNVSGHIYARRGKTPNAVLMHRQILNVGDDELVDHVDGNGLNNTRANLRVATHQENMWNRKPHKKRVDAAERHSEFKGVSWDKCKQRWRARIRVDGAQKSLGRFKDERTAAKAYNEAAEKYHGEFARTNKVA